MSQWNAVVYIAMGNSFEAMCISLFAAYMVGVGVYSVLPACTFNYYYTVSLLTYYTQL